MKVKGSNLLTLVNFNEKKGGMQDVFPTTLYNYFLFSFTKYDTYSRICTRSKKQGYTSLAITDKDVLYGAPEFYRICVEEGVQPIIGLHLSYTYEEKIMACLRTQKMK